MLLTWNCACREIVKVSLPSGRVLRRTQVPFRPLDVIPFDNYLLTYGQSSEIHILHQSTLELLTALSGLPCWPIPVYLFAGQIVTLNAEGEGQLWKIWEGEGRFERISVHTSNLRKKFSGEPKKSYQRKKDAASVSLGFSDYGSIKHVYNVGEVYWLVVQLNGWCLHKWEEDDFVEIKKEPLRHVLDAMTSKDLDNTLANWFAVYNRYGEVTFVDLEGHRNEKDVKEKMRIVRLPGHEDPRECSLAMSTVYHCNSNLNQCGYSEASVSSTIPARNTLVDFFYSGGRIWYRFADLDTLEFQQPPIEIAKPKVPELLAPLTPFFPTPDYTFDDSEFVEALPHEPSPDENISDICSSATKFMGYVVFGCGCYVNAYSLFGFLLSFETPEKTVMIDEPGSHVSMLFTIEDKCLLVGLTTGNLYVIDQEWNLSRRIALFGAPVQYAMKLNSKQNAAIRDLLVVTSKDGTVAVVNLPQRVKIYTFPGHFSQLYLIATPTDSNVLMVFYEDLCCRLCNLRSGKIEIQNEFTIESEEGWDMHYVQIRPKFPDDTVVFTHSLYAIDGSATAVVNVHALITQLNERTIAMEADVQEKNSLTTTTTTKTAARHALESAKAVLSVLCPSDIFEQGDEIRDLLFLDRPGHLEGRRAKLGTRGISDTLSIVHSAQDVLAVSGEITAMVVLTAVVLAKCVLEVELRLSDEEALEKTLSRFVKAIFSKLSVTAGVSAGTYRQPWLREFARFWTNDYDAIRHAARTCLVERIVQLASRPKELSNTISRWRIMLPGVSRLYPVGSNLSDRNPLTTFSRTTTRDSLGGGDVADGQDRSVGRISADLDNDDHDFYFNVDVLAHEVKVEETLLSVIILANIAIEQPERMSHGAHREIVAALQLMISDEYESEYQDVAIELIGIGWRVWVDRYFYPDDVLYRLMELFGGDTVPIHRKREQEFEDDKISPGVTSKVRQRHNLLVATARHIGVRSFNRVIEIASHKIRTDAAPTRIGAIKFMICLIRARPELLVDRLFPVVDATIATLDPVSGGVRNKVVNTVTILLNELVTAYPFYASHRPQQRLAMAMRPDTVVVYDLRAGTQLATLEGANSMLYNVTFSPEGRHVLAVEVAERKVHIWKVGHSFMSVVKSIGGGGSVGSAGGLSEFSKDRMFPRFTARLEIVELDAMLDVFADTMEANKFAVEWKVEKVVVMTVNGRTQKIDFSGS